MTAAAKAHWRNGFIGFCRKRFGKGGGSKVNAEVTQAKTDIHNAKDVVELLVVLLKICRRHAKALQAANENWLQFRDEAARLEELATKTFTSRGLSPQTKALAKDTLQQASDFAVAARALALGVDMAMQSRYPCPHRTVYRQLCAKLAVRELREDDPYPTTSFDLGAMYGPGGGFSRRRGRNAATAVDCVHGLALWPSDQSLRVIYDTEAGARLDAALDQAVTILAVSPNQDAAEFDFSMSGSGFFPVAVRKIQRQDGIVQSALQVAAEKGANIVVTPELSSTTNTVDLIKQNTGDGWPPIVIAGGRHMAVEGRHVNRLTTIYTGPNPLVREHDKIGEFVFTAGNSELAEGINLSSALRIHAGTRWSMIPLICADFLEDEVVRAVADLGPRLVVVPSMSRETGDFEQSMGEVIRKSQALVVVVNGPHEWWNVDKVPVVVIGLPLKRDWIRNLSPSPSDAAPHMALFSSAERKAEFV
jgi:hypothetical protein